MIISCDICLNDHYSDDILQNNDNETDNNFIQLELYNIIWLPGLPSATFPIKKGFFVTVVG